MTDRLVRSLVAMAIVGLVSVVPVSTALACSCAQASTVESLGFADVAFIGTAVAAEAPRPGEVISTADPIHYSFAVDTVFKGALTDAEIVAATAMDGASCGTSFGIDERWLVFANVSDGEVWTGLCSGNVLIMGGADEEALLAELGTPIAEPEPSAPAEAQPFEIPVALVVAVAGAAIVIGFSAWAFVLEPRRRAG
jgi:hypothetical protein